MSRARNRADGDFGDLDITNIGAVSLDSIKGDADGNTSLAFSGSDVITITTGGTTAATIGATQLLTITDDLVIKSGGTIGGANDTDLLTLGNAALTVAGTLAATTGTFSGILKTDDATEATSTTDGSLQTDGGLSVVKDAVFGDDVKLLSDGSVLSFGASSGNVSLSHVIDTGLLLNSSRVIQFRDSAISIGSPTDGDLDINADDEIELNSTLVDVNANLDVSGTIVSGGTLTATTSIGIGSAVLTEAELELLDGITAGTAAASKVLVLDSNKDIGTIRNLTIDGTFSDGNYTFDTSGNVSGLGTVASGNITSSGTVQGTTITATTAFVPDASDGAALGTSSLEFSDLFLADGAVISLGDDDDVTLTHVADTGILLSSTDQFQFGDSGTYIHQSADGVLDLVSDTEIELNATLIDINGNVEISGTTTQTGISTSTAKDVFNAGLSVKNGSTSAGFVEFFEDSDNGTNKVTVIGPASTDDVTVVLPSAAGTLSTTDDATALAIALG